MSRDMQATKEDIRAWILSRYKTRIPLPDITDIQRAVGWTRPSAASRQSKPAFSGNLSFQQQPRRI
jgi:hypothetical protein